VKEDLFLSPQPHAGGELLRGHDSETNEN